MKMIFESILLEKVQDQLDEEMKKCQHEKDSENYKEEYRKNLQLVTFSFFKVRETKIN